MIERHLNKNRRGVDEPTCRVDGEASGVVVRVAAFIGVREYGNGFFRSQQQGEAPRQTG